MEINFPHRIFNFFSELATSLGQLKLCLLAHAPMKLAPFLLARHRPIHKLAINALSFRAPLSFLLLSAAVASLGPACAPGPNSGLWRPNQAKQNIELRNCENSKRGQKDYLSYGSAKIAWR